METFYVIISFIFFFISVKFLFRIRQRKLNLPPSPPWSLPIIGHLRLLKLPLHRTFLSLSKSLNTSVFSLKLVTRLVVVVSSYSAVVECSTVNDVVLSNRPRFIASDHIAYNSSTMVATPYGQSWRNLRRIVQTEILSTHRLDSFLSIRQDEVRRLLLYLSTKSQQEFVKVEMMRSLFLDMTLNNILRMIAGRRFYGHGTEEGDEAKNVKQVIAGINNSGGPGKAADYFPILRYVTTYEKKVKKVARQSDAFLQGLVNEKRAAKVKGNTMIEHLLSLQETQPDYYTDVIIKGLILNMVVAGTDTSAGTLEWALASVLNQPEVLQKAKIEIDDQIGFDRLMEEQDLVKLPYLQNIVHEALRLYPVTPLLLPRLASDDCTIQGYDVPRGTTVLVNAWAINRDPELWEEPDKFKPERFENEREAKIKKVMTFGNGRRACSGTGLAHRLVTLALGSMIQCFEWERVNGEDLDMRETENGTVMYKATSLEAMCKARPIVRKIFDD